MMNKEEAEIVVKDTIEYANKEIQQSKNKYRKILLIICVILFCLIIFFIRIIALSII